MRLFKRFLAFFIAFIMFIPYTVFAEDKNYIYVPEIDVEDEVKDGNFFYLASSEVEMQENSYGHYLVKIKRGGEAKSESSIIVKLSDITAKYGKDYKVYLYNGGLFNEAKKEKDSQSVIEKIEGQDYENFEVNGAEELAEAIGDNISSQAAIVAEIGKGLNEAIAQNKEAKGENGSDYEKAASDIQVNEGDLSTLEAIPYGFEEENSQEFSEETTENTTDESLDNSDLNTLKGAREAFTGVKSDRVKPNASMDIIDEFEQLKAYQDLADTISDSLTGATLKVDFAEGEDEKYIEIVPINNDESDSTRVFNIIIGDPTGDYTVSAYSTAVAKIYDDEDVKRATVSFEKAEVTAETGKESVSITITRDGGINDLVSVMLKSKSLTAMSGRDFSPVNAEVVFPFGVNQRTVEIPINQSYISESADFELYLEDATSCEIGENKSVKVTLNSSAKAEETKVSTLANNDIEDTQITPLMDDSTYKNNIRVYFPRITTTNSKGRYEEKSGGFKNHSQVEGTYGWYIRPTDDRKWARAEFTPDGNSFTERYDTAGMTFSYRGHYAAHPHDGTAKAGFRTTDFENEFNWSGGSSGWKEHTTYTNHAGIRGVQVYAEDDKGSGRDIQAHFSDIYPIKRQFKINLESADKMYLRTANGNSVELKEVQPMAKISNKMSKSLGIDDADTDILAYRTSGETLSITATNNSYFRLKGIYAVNSEDSSQIIKLADANGSNTCSFTLNNDVLKKLILRDGSENFDYVTFSNRSNGGLYGNITIKPVFEYIDKKVYVQKNTNFENKVSINAYNNFGNISVNGKEYILADNQQSLEIKPNDWLGTTYHYGDEFVVKTIAKKTDMAKANGIGYRVGASIDNLTGMFTDKKNANGSYTFTRSNSNDIFKNNVVTFYPIYTEKQNGLTLMVKKSDVDNHIIDTTYGVMKDFNADKAVVDTFNGVQYYRFASSTSSNIKIGNYYQYLARAVGDYAVKWFDKLDNKTYSGNNMFYYVNGLSQDDNILMLSAEKNSINIQFKGNLNYNVYDISQGQNSGITMPLANASISIGNIGAITDNKGGYSTSNVGKFINNTYVIERTIVDNKESYNSYLININNKKIVTQENKNFEAENVKYAENTFKTETINNTKTVYTINRGNNIAEINNSGVGISDVNVYRENSTVAENGVIDIDDTSYIFRATVRENSDEHVKALKFIICDPLTKIKKYEINAKYESSSGQWVAKEKLMITMNGTYTKGDTLFAVISTDKNVSGVSGALKEYNPVYTGYDFIQGDSAYDSYEPQNFNIPTNASFVSLPVLDKLATGFDFPFVSIALEKRNNGDYRVKIGVNVADIIDKTADTNLNPDPYAEMGYTENIDWLHHPFRELGARAEYAFDSIFKKGLKSTPLLSGTTSRFGPSQFNLSIMVGGYIDFGKVKVTYNGEEITDFIVTGAGGYIGVSITFKKAFYFLIAGTVPAYIGGSASGTLIGNLGATRKSNAVVSLSSMKDKQLELDDAMVFNGNLNATASVALYAGVGLCDVLGLRVEGDVDLSLLWEPLAKQTYAMNDEIDEEDSKNSKIHEVGFTVAFSLGGKVDLLLFTIPLMYSFKPLNYGFNKDIQNAHLRKTQVDKIEINGNETNVNTTGVMGDGWYYITNVDNGAYLGIDNGKVTMLKNNGTVSDKIMIYVSTTGKVSTFAIKDGYSKNSAKYIEYLTENNVKSLKVSNALKSSSLNAYHKFYIKEVNEGDFNIMPSNETEKYIYLDDEENIVIGDAVANKKMLWRFEAINEPILNGLYKIKNNKEDKYLTEENGKAIIKSNVNDNSQTWRTEIKGDYITLQNVKSKNYLYLSKNSGNNGIEITVNGNDDSDALLFATNKLIDGNYQITTKSSLGEKYLTVYNDGTNVVSNSANDTYGQAWCFEPVEITESNSKTSSKIKTQNSSANLNALEIENNVTDYDRSLAVYNDTNVYSDNNVYLRERTSGDSQWVANESGIQTLSGFNQVKETTLVKNSYERPDSQVVDLGDGNYMLFFIDNDNSRGELDRTVLKFATYKNGVWSTPTVIQNDGTADFQHNVTDAGDNIAVTWISSAPESEKTGDATQYLTTMEVYFTLINKQTGNVGEITRLTKDSYYDYSPKVIYDEKTGNTAVFYIKTSVGDSFKDTANSFTNDCIITYMIYDNSMGKWLTDYYYPEEVSDENIAQELIKNWGGQRFLPPAKVDDVDYTDDPLITDFTAIGYNGLIVYAYTIDKDNDSSTNDDRDLYIQVYDFTSHKNFKPIKITDDSDQEIADTIPQFVRAGGENGDTYLYWFRGDNKLAYVNISDFAHNGLNNDGTISDSYDLAPAMVDVKLPPSMAKGSGDAYASMSYYKVYVDSEDNIYVIWVDLDRETNKQEIFATAVITDEESGKTSYADAYQLTHSGKNNDEPAFLVDKNGNMIVISTRYNSERTDDPINPLNITDIELVSTMFEPFGEIYAEDVEIDNETPKKGDTVNVTAKLYNRGLTVSKGYTVNISEMKDGKVIRNLDTITSSDFINAGDFVDFSYQWVIGGNIDGVSLCLTLTEGEMQNSSTTETDKLKSSANIKIDGVGISQDNQDFILHFTATNNGNSSTSENDKINLVYNPEKAKASQLGIINESFVKETIGGIEVGESKEYNIVIGNLNGEMFNAYGYLPVIAAVTDKDDNIISNVEENYIMMNSPIDIKINDTNKINLNVGEGVELNMVYSPFERFNDVVPNFTVENSDIAAIIDNQIVGVSKGNTKLVANAEPYKSKAEIEVFVDGTIREETTEATTEETTKSSRGGSGNSSIVGKSIEETTEPTSENQTDNNDNETIFNDIANHWAKDIILEAYYKGLINGYKDNSYKPNNNVTRAEFITMFYNSIKDDEKFEISDAKNINFEDITGEEWYAQSVSWGVENGIINGYDDNTFRGNNEISRQEMAVIVSKFIEFRNNDFEKGEPINFADKLEIADWAKEYVDNISAYGIAKGDNNNCYMPRKSLNRGEAAVIINNIIK